MTKHEKFLQELRAPVLRAERAQQCAEAKTKTVSGTIPGQSHRGGFRRTPPTYEAIQAERKVIFDELFGTDTEDDD